MSDLPLVMTAAGLQPRTPAELRLTLTTNVAATNPGYTANLPGGLIEDIASTDVGALALIDAARVEIVNSLTPFGANAFLLLELGQIYIGPGSMPAPPTNTSVRVVFAGPPGFVVVAGFVVSDGTYQYTVQEPGGIIAADGFTAPLFCLATIDGSWAIPASTVDQLVTSVPDDVALTCVNPLAGTPGGDAETEEEYRARVLTAGQAVSQGMATRLKTELRQVDGVQARLISVRQQSGGGWEVICGGGDPYEVAYAIYRALFDISTLVGSVLSVVDITQANPGVVTTDLNHNYATGQHAEMSGIVGMTPLNGVPFSAIVTGEKSFKLAGAIDLVSLAWGSAGGGTVTGSAVSAHSLGIGDEFTISGAVPDAYDGTYTALAGTVGNVIVYALADNPGVASDAGELLIGINTLGYPVYISGGVVLPSLRTQSPDIYDAPDIYAVPFVDPPQQTVTVATTYNTTAANFASQAAVAQLAAPAIAAYINSILVGAPINILLMEQAFLEAVVSVLPSSQVSVLNFAVSINAISTLPETGTKLIFGDPESYFYALSSGVTVTQA